MERQVQDMLTEEAQENPLDVVSADQVKESLLANGWFVAEGVTLVHGSGDGIV